MTRRTALPFRLVEPLILGDLVRHKPRPYLACVFGDRHTHMHTDEF